MTQNDFLEKFAAQFEETDPATITPETKFRDIEEWSSMMALIVIAMVDESYNITLSGDEIRKSVTVNDLYEICAAKN